MSLRVWLPLNGTLDNQGLDNITTTLSGGIAIDNSGKIGKCYNFDGTNGQLLLTNLDLRGLPQVSFAFWCCPVEDLTGLFQISVGGTHRVQIGTSTLSFRDSNNSTLRNVSYNTTFTPNTWVHMACIYNRGQITMYVNGIQTNHNTTYYHDNSVFYSDLNQYRIGRIRVSSGDVYYNGKLNDFRIYDHALSAMEVKQLSQGLILHYLLNAKNLFNYHTTTYAKSFAPSGNIQDTSGWAISDYIPIFPNQSYLGIGLSAGGSNTYAVLYDVNKNKTRTILEVANQNLIVNSNQNEYYIRLSIRDFNHELTTTAKFLENNDIQYDCSGYQKNGIKNGSFLYEGDTPKYNVSTMLNGSNYIEAEPLPDETKTISVWVNYQTLPTGSDYSGFIMFDKNTQISICVYSGGQYLIPYIGSSKGGTGSRVITSFQTNKWYHIVVLKTGVTTREVYINGVKATPSGTNYWSGGLNKLLIGVRHAAGVYKDGANAKICDFRAYATLLSEQEILSLYHNEAFIDNNGNIYGAIYEEA